MEEGSKRRSSAAAFGARTSGKIRESEARRRFVGGF